MEERFYWRKLCYAQWRRWAFGIDLDFSHYAPGEGGIHLYLGPLVLGLVRESDNGLPF